MSTPPGRDWYRSSSWSPQIAGDFEERLRRVRPAHRAQYLRIQAAHLLNSPSPATREAGRDLLRRVIAEYPDDTLEVTTAAGQLGCSLAGDGRLAAAERMLRQVLRLCAESPIGRSGTSGTTELRTWAAVRER